MSHTPRYGAHVGRAVLSKAALLIPNVRQSNCVAISIAIAKQTTAPDYLSVSARSTLNACESLLELEVLPGSR